jgi:hypothetical protein
VEVSLTISPVKDERGNIIGASKILRDISDRKRMEQPLLQAEKIAALDVWQRPLRTRLIILWKQS